MMSPESKPSRHDLRRVRTLAGVCMLALAFGPLTGCGEEEKPPPPPPKPVAKAPEPELSPLEELPMDPRVQFPEERAPASRSMAEAIAGLASAIATGDADQAAEWLAEPDRMVLDQLIESGGWGKATSALEIVRVCVLEQTDQTCTVGLGVQDSEEAYLLAWDGASTDGQWTFTARPLVEITAPVAADLDGAELRAPVIPEAEYEVLDTGGDEEETRRSGGPR